MAAPPSSEPPLPEAVEMLINAICLEKSQPPPDADARRHLSKVGEQESLRILIIISNSSSVRNFSGYIVHLVTKTSSPSPRSPLAISPLSRTVSPQGNTSRGVKRERDFDDCPGNVSAARRVCIFNSPTTKQECNEEKPEVPKSALDIVLDALEKLEFRKAYLILNYAGSSKLEDVVTADKIQSYQTLGMREFEIQIWNDFGRANCEGKGRIETMNWDTGERYNYHCHVDSNGNCRYKGPIRNKAATLLQKTVGDENVLIVKFMEQETERRRALSLRQSPVFNVVAKNGIFVGRKCYRFFVFKDGGKEEKKKVPTSSPVKCYFVCMEGFASLLGMPPHLLKNVSVPEARGLFMHIHKATSISNYMARFSLILSKTITLDLNFNEVLVEVIDDEPCRDEDGEIVYDKDGKALILTDGTGYISEDIALRCPLNCSNGCVNSEENDQDLQGSLQAFRFPHNYSGLSELKSLPGVPPLLIQFRMFHKGRPIKGTVLVNRKLPPNTILVRRSMLKVDSDANLASAPTVNSFEVVATSNKPKVATLSKNLIALLHYGGVPKDVFLAMLWEALTKPLSVLYRTKAAVKVAVNWDFTDEFIAARMVASGIPLDEPYLQYRLSEIPKEEMKNLKSGKIPVSGSFYVMGTADPT